MTLIAAEVNALRLPDSFQRLVWIDFLCFPPDLGLFVAVPESGEIRAGWKHDISMVNAALSDVVMGQTVLLICQFRIALVSDGFGRPAFAPLED